MHLAASRVVWCDCNSTSRDALQYNKDVAILFADVAGFTAMSEKMEPFKLVNWLNSYFSLFDQVANKYCVVSMCG